MFSLKDKEAIISGGGSGIGKSIAALFAAQGAIVHIIDLDKLNAETTTKEINATGKAAYYYHCDVTNQHDVDDVLASIGKVDILVNCAGIAHIGKADTTSEADFVRLFEVNVKGVYNCIHGAIPIMKKTGGGVILNIASIAALVGLADRFAYSMTKGAVYAMTLSVAKDYLQDNIRCNSVSPARIYTPFVAGFLEKNYAGKEEETFEKLSKSQPIGRMGTTEEVAALALYLCSSEASFVTGNDYPIDGGFIKLNN